MSIYQLWKASNRDRTDLDEPAVAIIDGQRFALTEDVLATWIVESTPGDILAVESVGNLHKTAGGNIELRSTTGMDGAGDRYRHAASMQKTTRRDRGQPSGFGDALIREWKRTCRSVEL